MVFAIVGFIAGWNDRKEIAANKIYKELEIIKKGDQYYLEISYDGKFRYHYSVDNNTLESVAQSRENLLAYAQNSLGKASDRNNEIVSKLGNFIGPTAGVSVSVYSAMDFIKKPKAWAWSNIKKNVAMLLGGISGYFVGEYIGSNIWTDPDSDLAQELINDDMAMWESFERKMLIATLIEMQTTKDAVIFGTNNIAMIGDDPMQLCQCGFSKKLESTLQQYLKKTQGFNSEDFRTVDGFQTKLNKAYSLETYSELNKLSTAHSLSKVNSTNKFNSLKSGMGYSDKKWKANCAKLCTALDDPIKIGIIRSADLTRD